MRPGASLITSLTFSRHNTHVLEVAEIPQLIPYCFTFQITSVWSQAGGEREKADKETKRTEMSYAGHHFLIGLEIYHRHMTVCTQANSHTLSPHTFLYSTCVLLSFPDLFGESVGTSEALKECLERKTQERQEVMIFIFLDK